MSANAGNANSGDVGTLPGQSTIPASTDNLASALVSENAASADNGDRYRRRSRSVSDTLEGFFGVWRNRPYDTEDDSTT